MKVYKFTEVYKFVHACTFEVYKSVQVYIPTGYFSHIYSLQIYTGNGELYPTRT